MPCPLCKDQNHTLMECRDDSIFETMDEITMNCTRIISYDRNTLTLIYEMEEHVKKLSCVMLKSILYNTPEINTDDDYTFNGSGKKITLIGKVIYLYLSNMRRKHPIRFLKQSRDVRQTIFLQQLYWHKIADGSSEYIANRTASRYAETVETRYTQWVTSINIDTNSIIEHTMDNSFVYNSFIHTEYNLRERGTEESNLHSRFVTTLECTILREINYCANESFYLKKMIMNYYLTTQYRTLIQYMYTNDGTLQLLVRNNYFHELGSEGQDYIIGHPHSGGAKHRKWNIEIILEKEANDCANFDCVICLDSKTDKDGRFVLSCNHEFCGTCMNYSLNDYRSKTTLPACALCRGVIDTITVKNAEIADNKIVENLNTVCAF